MKTTTLLIEIGVEELPTKAVTDLATAGEQLWAAALDEAAIPHGNIESFGSPRRLAWRIHELATQQPDQKIERKGPSVQAAKDADGNWTKAALGFAASCGVDINTLSIENTGKTDNLMYRGEEKGQALTALLPTLFETVMSKLPIAKRMRWADHDAAFVRPVNTLVALADSDIVPLSYFGIAASNQSLGHRVHHPEPVIIKNATSYEADLKAAHVIAAHDTRQTLIREQVSAEATKLGGQAIMPDDLVHEVASLTEWPVAIVGGFEEKYLDVPQEVLITTMQDNQKTFAVTDKHGKILPHFIAIANIESKNPDSVRKGNEKVIRPRFADAEFFWQQDLKKTLDDYLPALENVIYQQQLGSIADKTRRISQLASDLAPQTGANIDNVTQAATLAKSDLLTEMVMEFPELQGLMGRYYAQKQGLNDDIAYALEEQYYPLGAGGALPSTSTGTTLAIAEKLDTLIGGFAIGAKPTGSKDPYALRRMAIGLIRLIIEKNLELPLTPWLEKAASTYPSTLNAAQHINEVRDYILERLQAHYREQNIDADTYQAVRALGSDNLLDIDKRIHALQAYLQTSSAHSLLASAKRIRNILRKNGENPTAVQENLLEIQAEKTLWDTWQPIAHEITTAIQAQDYHKALHALHQLAAPLEKFFEDVMVMSEKETLRQNRLALLTQLQQGFDQIADLSLLS